MKTKEITDIVNGLLKKSFGVGVRGDWKSDYPETFFGIGRKPKDLGYIGRNLGIYIKRMGEFLDEEGTFLMVYRKYERQAQKYAEMYKEKFGKKVTIEVMEEARE